MFIVFFSVNYVSFYFLLPFANNLMLCHYIVVQCTVIHEQDFCLCENKGADQLGSNCEADQHLCFHFSDSTIPLLSKSKISSL